MGIHEERNIATLLRWNHEVWGLGRTELAPELLAPAYVRHDPSGVRAWTPEEYAAEVASRGGPRIRSDEIIARGDFVGLRWSLLHSPADAPFAGGLQVYQFDVEHRMRAMWGGLRPASAGPWPDDGEATHWQIADRDALTEEERRNEATHQTAWARREASDPTGLHALFLQENLVRGPVVDRTETIEKFADRIRRQPQDYPAMQFDWRIHFAVGDRSVEVVAQVWDDRDGPEVRGMRLRSPTEFIQFTRYEDAKIAERWQVAAPPGVSWAEDSGQAAT